MKIINPEEFKDMIALRDECLEKSLQASLYKEYCAEHPWVPAQNVISLSDMDSGLISQDFVNEMYRRTMEVCTRDEFAYENAAHQIEDQAFIKLTAQLLETGDLSICRI